VNCIRVPCALSHTEIGNFPQPTPWKSSSANDNTRWAADLLHRQIVPSQKQEGKTGSQNTR